MIRKNLREALDNGLDVFIQMNYCCGSKFVGMLMDMDEEFFTVLTFKQDYRMQIVLKIQDVQYVCIYKENFINFGETKEVKSQAQKLLENEGGI